MKKQAQSKLQNLNIHIIKINMDKKELLGYLGMILVVGSFLFNPATGEPFFHIINLSGAIVSMIYALLIKSKPVFYMNVCITVFDILHLSGVHFAPF